jgi:hypothetical protein
MPFNQNAAAYAQLFKSQMQQDTDKQNQFGSQAYTPAPVQPKSNQGLISEVLSDYNNWVSNYQPHMTYKPEYIDGWGTFQKENGYSTPTTDEYMATKGTTGGAK